MHILILTSSTGGGHDMRAAAFARWAERLTDWRVTIHPTLENTHAVYGFGVSIYNWIQRTWPTLHHVYYNYLELAGTVKRGSLILGAGRFRALLEDLRPDVVLSTHDHLNHGFFDLARSTLGRDRVRCVTYCGELHGGYGFSKLWVNPDADLFIGAVDEVRDEAVRLGMDPARAITGGFLLHPEFDAPAMTESERCEYLDRELGFDAERFVLLLGTGAAGANNHVALLEHLGRRREAIQVAAMCGRDAAARARVERWAAAQDLLDVRALGYRDDMAALLQAASAVVTRPGTGTTSEAIARGCPVVFNGVGGIMPQEMITVRYARRHGFERTLHRARDIGPILDEWLAAPATYLNARNAIAAAAPAGHPSDILAHVAGDA